MHNEDELIKKIDEGIRFLVRQDKKLTPVINFLTRSCVKDMEKLSPDKKFEYLLQITNLKVESLLLLTKMKEILEFSKNEKNF